MFYKQSLTLIAIGLLANKALAVGAVRCECVSNHDHAGRVDNAFRDELFQWTRETMGACCRKQPKYKAPVRDSGRDYDPKAHYIYDYYGRLILDSDVIHLNANGKCAAGGFQWKKGDELINPIEADMFSACCESASTQIEDSNGVKVNVQATAECIDANWNKINF